MFIPTQISKRQFLKLTASTALVAGLNNSVLAASVLADGVRVETGPAFGSTWRLVMANSADALLARKHIETVVRRTDKLMSPFQKDSEIAEFNFANNINASSNITISKKTASVLRMALDIAGASDGAFDPTSAPMGRRFGFGSTYISATRPAGHYRDISLNGNQLRASRPGLSLDLCAIAKGHALDEMKRALDGMDFLLELGGEIAASGHHPSGRPWRMGIELPGTKKLLRAIEWDGRALATSGNGAEGYDFGGRLYGHVVDPRTAKPANDKVVQVSVLAPTGQLADGLATAALVLGPNSARHMLATFDASALFIMRDKNKLLEVDVLGFGHGYKT